MAHPLDGSPTDEPSATDTSTAELVQRMSAQVSGLVRDELALATAELKQKATKTGIGVGLTGTGGLLSLYGLGALVTAAVLGLATVLYTWLAALIVGVTLLVVSGLLAMLGIGKVRDAAPLVPEQAVESSRLDVKTVKESVRR